MTTPTVECGVSSQTMRSWKDFVLFIQDNHANCPAYIYRGQADTKWKIESAIDRLETRYSTTNNYSTGSPKVFPVSPAQREVHLEAFKECVRGKRGGNPQELSENEWWALAQHHGLASPLVDWSYSPFVALFFAFEEEGYVDGVERVYRVPEVRVVYSVPFHFFCDYRNTEQTAPTVFSPRREVTHRLSSQSGVLMKMPPKSDLESIVRDRHSEDTSATSLHARSILTKINIPSEGRAECLKFLNKMNINRMSLFADLDGAARYINSLWET